jgi:hypothetical protein
MAERRIAEGVPQSDDDRPGPPRADAKGIICYISNYSWLDGLSHTGMRERFLEVFDSIAIDCLNGDKFKTGKKTPDGQPDPSAFSTDKNREGIQVGTAIALLERRPQAKPRGKDIDATAYEPNASVTFRHWWGKEKRTEIEASLMRTVASIPLTPSLQLGLPFLPVGVRDDYTTWYTLVELLPQSFAGVKTSRDNAVVDIEKDVIQERISLFTNPSVTDAELRRVCPSLMSATKSYNPSDVRKAFTTGKQAIQIVRYAYRPFDNRWLAWEGTAELLDRPRPEYARNLIPENIWLSATQRNRKEDFYQPQVTRCLADHHIVESNVGMFPVFLAPAADESAPDIQPDLFASKKPSGPQPNLTEFAKTYLEKLKCGPEDLFFHIVAVLHAPVYREENAGALRQDWPRLPLPTTAQILRAGANLGHKIAALLDAETPVEGVTSLKVRTDLKGLGELALKPGEKTPDLELKARWGYAGQNGVTMPGPGKTSAGTQGEGFIDIHLNTTTRWKDVPVAVWNYTLGGYQVLKKWLSYREVELLGRPLTSDEAHQFTHHVRRIAAILAMHGELNAHYQAAANPSESA